MKAELTLINIDEYRRLRCLDISNKYLRATIDNLLDFLQSAEHLQSEQIVKVCLAILGECGNDRKQLDMASEVE